MHCFSENQTQTPKKIPKLVEIVPDMYPDLLFGDMS